LFLDLAKRSIAMPLGKRMTVETVHVIAGSIGNVSISFATMTPRLRLFHTFYWR
jgi:hypothetical protein